MMNLKRSDGGAIKYELLSQETVPQIAKPFFIDMAIIERGINTIPYALRETIREDQGLIPEDFQQMWPDNCFQSKHEADNLPGRIPSFALIKQPLSRAKECEICKQDEACWNWMVHFSLLRNIFEDSFGKQYDNITARSCTTAWPHREFGPNLGPNSMIDACLCAKLDDSPEVQKAMQDFIDITPNGSVNFTDFYALKDHVILSPLETKPLTGEGLDKAQLQISVWLGAQWDFLYWAVRQKLLKQQSAKGLDDEEILKAETNEALSKLGFIPAILVLGHEWHLALSTYNGGNTTIWAQSRFGSTEALQKFFSVIAGVRRLAAWGRDVYLPWFQENVLAVGES
ncbi:hypothetical protein ACQKWADRAFT_296418 [Trichoderma austrokoningii]